MSPSQQRQEGGTTGIPVLKENTEGRRGEAKPLSEKLQKPDLNPGPQLQTTGGGVDTTRAADFTEEQSVRSSPSIP